MSKNETGLYCELTTEVLFSIGLGMMNEINKGLHKKFVLNGGEVTGNG